MFMGDETWSGSRHDFSGETAMQFGKRARAFTRARHVSRGPLWPHSVHRCAGEKHARVASYLRGNQLDSTRLAASSIGEVVATQPRLRREVNTSRHPTFTSVASRSVVTRLPLVAIAATTAEGRHRAGHQGAFQDLRSKAYGPAARNTIGRSRQCLMVVSLSWKI